MSSKSKTTSDQTNHSVVTPSNPAWVTGPVQSLAGRIGDLSNLDPYSLVPGANPLQTQAAGALSGLAPDGGVYDSAHGLFQALMDQQAPQVRAATGAAASLLPNLQAYMSPYTHSVVDSALADYDFGAGQTRAQNQLALANDDTFGGSGGAIQTALSNDAINRGRGALSGQLLDQGFQTGANLANLDADRGQQMNLANMAALNQARQFNAAQLEAAYGRQRAAGEDLVNTANLRNQTTLADAAAQAQLGDQLRQIQSAQTMAPVNFLTSQAGLLNSLPLSLYHGDVTDSTGHGASSSSSFDPINAFATLAGGLKTLSGIPGFPGAKG